MKTLLLTLLFCLSAFGNDYGLAPEWQLELYHRDDSFHRSQMVCKASMLSPQWAITAAHCTSNKDSEAQLDSRQIVLRDDFGIEYNVTPQGIHNNTNYDAERLLGDFALLRIEPLGVSRVKKFVHLSLKYDLENPKKIFTTKWTPQAKDRNKHLSFPILNIEQEIEAFNSDSNYSLFNVQSPFKLCIEEKSSDNTINHKGSNSGSPLYYTDKKGRDRIIGLHSKSRGCETEYLFTNLTQHVKDILHIMEINSH